jgi:hypothetical protein
LREVLTPDEAIEELKNQLMPSYLQSQFASVRTILECGLPRLRNKTSGHGQGEEATELPALK